MLLRMISLAILIFGLLALAPANTYSQRRRRPARPAPAARPAEVGKPAVVIDETLAVLRDRPSLFATSLQRMRRGREVRILSSANADGVTFFRVSAPPNKTGWVQADAVFARFRPDDEARLARLVQAMDGFDRLETAAEFFKLYPKSSLRPQILLLFGDLLEEAAARLSRDAGSRLDRDEMAASGAAMHSYFLNYAGLDRYRKLGVTFLFNPQTRQFHYDGASWTEIVKTDGISAAEVSEAQKRLDSLKAKMAETARAR